MNTCTQRSGLIERTLQLVALTGLAASSPLLNILREGPEFFVNRRAMPVDIVSLVAIVVVVPPLILLAVEGCARVLGAAFSRFVHSVFVALLVSIIIVPLLESSGLSGWKILALSVAIGSSVSVCVARFVPARKWLAFLAILSGVSVGNFFLSDGIGTLLFPRHERLENGYTKSSATPVVVLIFDEFPLNGLLNRDLQIDAERFPNFAALVKDATWFQNAAAVNQFTPIALPAILSGRMPRSLKQLPTAESYPANLFTVLGRSHAIAAYEPFTRLCPDDLCRRKTKQTSWRGRLTFMLSDLAAVYLNYIVPEDLDLGVPTIDGKWGDFWEDTTADWDAPNFSRGDRVESFKRFIRGLKATGEKPPFIFAHIILPHMPHQFVPSGRMYAPGVIQGYVRDQWVDDQARREVSYQQFLLQLGATDRLVGEFIARLKELGIYEQAVLVAVADHGISFQPGTHRRGDVSNEAFYDDVMSIPLFIKRPGVGMGGISSKRAQTMDVVPTVLTLLGLDYDIQFDGKSLFTEADQDRTEQLLLVGRIPKKNAEEESERKKHELEGQVISFSPSVDRKRATIDWKYKVEGYTSPNPYNPYYLGPHSDLLGRPVSDFAVGVSSSIFVFHARNGKPDPNRVHGVLRYDPRSGVCPCNLQGVVIGSDLKAGDEVAVAINGVLQSFARLIPSTAYAGNFVFFVLDKAFKAGENKVEIFKVLPAADNAIRLERLSPENS